MVIKGYYDLDQLLSKIYDIEGFHYFFNDYLSLDEVTDPRLLVLINNYRQATDNLENYINSLSDEDV